jgi:hypothetical protein
VRFSGFIYTPVSGDRRATELSKICQKPKSANALQEISLHTSFAALQFLAAAQRQRYGLGMPERVKLTLEFNARTASLCLQTSGPATNSTHLMGTLCFCASATHLLRTSGSAFVLSTTAVVSEYSSWVMGYMLHMAIQGHAC